MSVRNGRPSKEYLSSLRPMGEDGASKLLLACMQAILSGKKHVILALSYLTKLPDDFPNVTTVRRDGKTNFVKVLPRPVIQWLNKHGYTTMTVDDLRIAQLKFTNKEKELEPF